MQQNQNFLPRGQYKFVKPDRLKKDSQSTNQASSYARSLIKSDYDRYFSNVGEDYKKVLDGGCTYLPHFLCGKNDKDIFNKLKKDMDTHEQSGLMKWSKHHKYENPDFSETFNDVIKKMSEHFNVEVMATRLNYYADGLDWKPMHHDSHAYHNDSHAYHNDSKKEDFTMGASFGDSRELEFLHEETGNRFKFPQHNGDIFAFDKEINKKFMHGVPKSRRRVGPRFSIIAWGKKITE